MDVFGSRPRPPPIWVGVVVGRKCSHDDRLHSAAQPQYGTGLSREPVAPTAMERFGVQRHRGCQSPSSSDLSRK